MLDFFQNQNFGIQRLDRRRLHPENQTERLISCDKGDDSNINLSLNLYELDDNFGGKLEPTHSGFSNWEAGKKQHFRGKIM